MKHYLTFSAADLAQDEEFLKWVKHPEQYPLLCERWLNFLKDHPHKREEVEEARLMILAVVKERQFIPDDETQQHVWDRVQESILEMEGAPKQVTLWQRWYSKAAAVLMIFGVGWFLIDSEKSVSKLADAGTETVLLEKYINNADVAKTIVLSDGSSIVLQPHSVLEYPRTFKPDVREVYLTGEGFFEVKRDVHRPFMVRTHELVTRVLGTSFTVRNYEGEKQVLVQVKTGKVSVFKEKTNERPGDENVEGVVLMPNQQVVYEREQMKLTKSLVENPSVLIPVAKQEFEFTDTPIGDVFRVIEEAYGVDVVYDEELLANCYLNASLDDVPLYDKLKLICKGVNATYEIIDSHIIIYGKGCGDPVDDTN